MFRGTPRRHIKPNVSIRGAPGWAPACCLLGEGFLLPPSPCPAPSLAHIACSPGEQAILVSLNRFTWGIWGPQPGPIACLDPHFALGVCGRQRQGGWTLTLYPALVGGSFLHTLRGSAGQPSCPGSPTNLLIPPFITYLKENI